MTAETTTLRLACERLADFVDDDKFVEELLERLQDNKAVTISFHFKHRLEGGIKVDVECDIHKAKYGVFGIKCVD
jgi:hypothetical protein